MKSNIVILENKCSSKLFDIIKKLYRVISLGIYAIYTIYKLS